MEDSLSKRQVFNRQFMKREVNFFSYHLSYQATKWIVESADIPKHDVLMPTPFYSVVDKMFWLTKCLILTQSIYIYTTPSHPYWASWCCFYLRNPSFSLTWPCTDLCLCLSSLLFYSRLLSSSYPPIFLHFHHGLPSAIKTPPNIKWNGNTALRLHWLH